MANSWLRICLETHHFCNDVDRVKLPIRLVSIAGGNPRLVITADLPVSLPLHHYATLSYCWGKKKFTQLRSDNLDAYELEIPLEGLPRTFRDAFRIVSALGIDFI